jgi:hypothetical protein
MEDDIAEATHMAGRRSSLKALGAGTASSNNRRRTSGMRPSDGGDQQELRGVSGGGSPGGEASILALARSNSIRQGWER